MLKKFVLRAFVALILAAPVISSAAINSEPAPIATNISLAKASTSNGNVNVQAVGIGSSEIRGIQSQQVDQNQMTLPATGWLLVIALVGFVMLSDRRGI